MTDSRDGAWSRAFLASSGLSVHSPGERRHPSAEEHEASNTDTAPARLRDLAVSKDQRVREAVAARRDCPLGTLAALAHDRKDDVRIAVAANEGAGLGVLEQLIGDRNLTVVLAVARNQGAPRPLIERLATHRRPEVRRAAARWLAEAPAGHPSDPTQLPAELVDRAQATAPHEATTASDMPTREPTVLAPRPAVPVRLAPDAPQRANGPIRAHSTRSR